MLMVVLANEMLTEILHRRIHLRHTDHVRNRTLGSDDASQRIRILFSELFEQHESKFTEQLILPTLFDDDGEAGR